MSNDVLITPASRKIEFKDSSGNVDAKLETDASGNLQITNAGGDISIGDTTSDVIIGDGTNSVDIVFEQNGEIRGTAGVTLTLGDSNTTLRTGTNLSLNSNDITNVSALSASGLISTTGNFIAEGNITAYGSASDIRIKENIEVIPDSVEKVKSLRGVTFNYKKDGKKSTGLVAQELQKVLPEAVYETKDSAEDGEDILAIRYGNVVGLLVEALKEQQTQIDNLATLVNELKEK